MRKRRERDVIVIRGELREIFEELELTLRIIFTDCRKFG